MNEKINSPWELWQTHRLPLIIIFIGTLLLGFILRGCFTGPAVQPGQEHGEETQAAAKKNETWTCSMHPQIQQPQFGKCPLCGMDLIVVDTGGDDAGVSAGQLKLTANAITLAAIQTSPVEHRFVATDIRMVGKVANDETRLGYITARIPGRLDRLYVDYTGVAIRKGDRLASLYSPQLIAAQQELLQSLKNFRKFGSGKLVVNAAREKLKLWGLHAKQIRDIEKRGKTVDHLTIYSPMSGIVIHKNAVEGMYVKTGSKIYTIVDLSKLWIKLDAYESDLPWIRYGQTVEFETEAYPGELFKGKISFIDPVLDPKTRTVKVRVNVDNAQLKLKPEMFIRAVVHSKLSMSGKVVNPDLAGKWISPMHPEVIKDKPGKCDVCGMALVKAEKLGYITEADTQHEAPLVIPASAPLLTGERAVVYIAVAGKEGVFEGRNVVLGPRAGDYYIVKEGLKEGEQVVSNGAFKIDSDLQIQAKPSMMNPPPAALAESSADDHTHDHSDEPPQNTSPAKTVDASNVPAAFKKSVAAVTDAYFIVQTALAADTLEPAKKGAVSLLEKLANVDMNLLKGDIHMEWMKLEKTIKKGSLKLSKAGDIEVARQHLDDITPPVTAATKLFYNGETTVYRFHCPMAFDNKGAYWLQNNPDTRNPYFGASMLTCKDSVEPLVSSKKNEKK